MANLHEIQPKPKGGPVAQVHRLGPRVGGRLTLFCIHSVNQVYGALVVTSLTLKCTVGLVFTARQHSLLCRVLY